MMKMLTRFAVAIAVAHFPFVVPQANAGLVSIVGDLGDGQVDVNGVAADLTDPTTRVGTGGDIVRGLSVVYFFELPTVPSAFAITDAQLQFEYLGIAEATVTTPPEFNVAVFGIDARPDAIIQSSDYYDGDAALSSDTLIQTATLTLSTASGNIGIANSSLLNFVETLYNLDGTPVSAFATFRLNPDKDLPEFSNPIRGYVVATADNVNSSLRPRLNLTVIPEPSTLTLLVLGALGLSAFGWRRRKR